jgi:hypothetical protein
MMKRASASLDATANRINRSPLKKSQLTRRPRNSADKTSRSIRLNFERK